MRCQLRQIEVSGWADALRVKHGPELYGADFLLSAMSKNGQPSLTFEYHPPMSNLKFAFYYAVRDSTTIVLNFLKYYRTEDIY